MLLYLTTYLFILYNTYDTYDMNEMNDDNNIRTGEHAVKAMIALPAAG